MNGIKVSPSEPSFRLSSKVKAISLKAYERFANRNSFADCLSRGGLLLALAYRLTVNRPLISLRLI